jgi:hypothetical protein
MCSNSKLNVEFDLGKKILQSLQAYILTFNYRENQVYYFHISGFQFNEWPTFIIGIFSSMACTMIVHEIAINMLVFLCHKSILHRLTNFWLHRAEPFMRSHQLCSHTIITRHVIVTKGLLPCSQELCISPYSEPDKSSWYHPNLSQPINKTSACKNRKAFVDRGE